jgi:hypothetical protein
LIAFESLQAIHIEGDFSPMKFSRRQSYAGPDLHRPIAEILNSMWKFAEPVAEK